MRRPKIVRDSKSCPRTTTATARNRAGDRLIPGSGALKISAAPGYLEHAQGDDK